MQNIEQDRMFENALSPQNGILWIFIILSGLILPLFLIPLVKFTGYSEIVEEITKALVVLFLILKLPSHKMQIIAGIGFGFLFGLSENMFYLNNIFQLGDFSIFWQRFLWTVPMHIITVLVMVFAALAGKKFLIFGLAGAIILHALFNGIVIEFLMQ
jgi:hypothetical protein